MHDTDEKMYLVLELVTGGDMYDSLIDEGAYPEARARKYMFQMLDAIKYLHSKGIVHRDMKPENVLFKDESKETLKITDFGLSRVVDDAVHMQTICGTPAYTAPEILASEGYDKACDLWSLGVLLYVMLSKTPPFNESKGNIWSQICNADFNFKSRAWNGISFGAKQLICKLLVTNPEERMNVDEALAHPWVKGEEVEPTPEEAQKMAKLERRRKRKRENGEEKESKRRKKGWSDSE
eukprot:TRINITY_DN4731_c0_g1_i2.p2 TRINITY_DN4731_c0_g1~~TRINITY_DN4731_c0_g1_i2.p2  ORF type:complete len:237 (-),score=71.00 TRINITY_DN4731_c0_g1_i2:950-1660(-)